MRVLIAGDRSSDRDLARGAALRIGLDCTSADCVPLVDVALRLSRQPAVHFAVVCLDPEPEAAFRAIKVGVEQFQQPVFAATTGDVAGVVDSAKRAGAIEVWAMDRVKEELLRSQGDLERKGTSPNRRGRIVAVSAAMPGSGATTIATGLAFAFERNSNVVLAELGSAVPQLALDLDLTPRHSLAELVEASDRMDSSMVRDTVVHHADGVDVLAYMPDTPTAPPLSANAIRDFTILLRNLYDWVILDAGHPRAGAADELIKHADRAIVVARLDPPSLRLTRAYMQSLANQGIPAERISIVANRFGQAGLIPWKKAEEALKVPVRAWFPDDPRNVNRALVEGKPLASVARRSSLNAEFAKLAAALQAEPARIR